METPRLKILVSPNGVEKVEVFYIPSQYSDVWQLCQEYLPLLLAKAPPEMPEETGK